MLYAVQIVKQFKADLLLVILGDVNKTDLISNYLLQQADSKEHIT